jgi:hypothetical protein
MKRLSFFCILVSITLIMCKPNNSIDISIVKPDGVFDGTIINSLTPNTTDFINANTSKITNSYKSERYPMSGISNLTVHIFTFETLPVSDFYPKIEILDADGKLVNKFKGSSLNNEKWVIGNYTNGMPSPDGTKIILTGEYMLHPNPSDPNFKNPFPITSIIDIKTGKELIWFECNYKLDFWEAVWTHKGDLLIPNKERGIDWVSSDFKVKKTILNRTCNFPKVSVDDKVFFGTGDGYFTMDIDGSNIKQFKGFIIDPTLSSIKLLTDVAWSPDGKSIGFLYKNAPLNEYFVWFSKLDSSKYGYLKVNKETIFTLKSPILNWK